MHRMTRSVIVAATLATATLAAGTPAYANPRGGGGAGEGGIDVWVADIEDGGIKGDNCGRWHRGADPTKDAPKPDLPDLPDAEVRILYSRLCNGKVQYVWVPLLGPVDVANIAYDRMRANVDPPTLATVADTDSNPEGWTFAQLPTWYWTDVDTWRTYTATASIPGLSATVTATPVALRFNPGDGSGARDCVGPGRAFDSTNPASIDDANNCSHVYTTSSAGEDDVAFTATISIVWQVSYTASNGAAGDLGPLVRNTTGRIEVAEVQSLVLAGG